MTDLKRYKHAQRTTEAGAVSAMKLREILVVEDTKRIIGKTEAGTVLYEGGYSTQYLERYTNLATALTAFGSTNTHLVISRTVTLIADTTIPENIILDFKKGGVIALAGFTLTINSALKLPEFQVFSGSGSVVGSGPFSNVNPKAFGATGLGVADDLTYINRAITCAYATSKTIHFPEGDYLVSGAIDLKTLFDYDFNTTTRMQGYFKIMGENPEKTRIIPGANITGAVISLDAESANESGGAANIRQIYIDGISIYSDTTRNAGVGYTADYGISMTWVAEVSIKNFYCINAVTKRAISLSTCFPIVIDNVNLTGKDNLRAPTGYGAPDGADLAKTYNVAQPLAVADRLTGVWIDGASTTLLMTNSRVRNFINGININGGEMLSFLNNAFESCESDKTEAQQDPTDPAYLPIENGIAHGVLISGSVSWFNLIGYYGEGNEVSLGINGTVVGGELTGSYPHDNIHIKTYSGIEINGLHVHHNSLRGGVYGLLDQGARFVGCSIHNNLIYVDAYKKEDYYKIIQPTNVTQMKMAIYDNYFKVEGTNRITTYYERQQTDLIDSKLLYWTASGGTTIAESSTKYNFRKCYDVVGTTGYLLYEFGSINQISRNQIVKNWYTLVVPAYRNSTAGGLNFSADFGVSSSAITGRVETQNVTGTFAQNTNYFSYDGKGVADFVYDETISWSGGTGVINGFAEGNDTTTGVIWFKLASGVIPTNDQTITGGTSGATALINGTTSVLDGLVLKSAQDYEGFTKVYFTTDNTLPTGISLSTPYYLGRMSEGRYFISTTPENADIDIIIAYTDSGTGNHTINSYDSFYTNYVYFLVPEGATKFDIKILPASGSFVIGQPALYKGLWMDDVFSTLNENDTRVQGLKGSDVASANDTTLSSGNYFDITGTTQINAIAVSGWQAGSEVTLQFDSTPTVKHNTAGSAGFASILLAGAVDFVAGTNDTLTLVYDGTTWREKCRTVI
jgi:hypothetical protein